MTIDKKIAYDMQGGVRNYLGKQKTVSDVPLKWKSGPDKPATELAYITKAEKDLLLKKDIHGSLKGGPNKGPGGIISLDSAGDKDGPVGGYSGADVSAAETGKAVKGMSARDLAGFRAGAISAGARAGLNETQAVKDQVKALQNKYGSRVGTNKFGFLSPKNIFTGLLGLINPAFGLLSKGLGYLGTKAQDLRGYNPDGSPRTQAEYEAAMRDRQIQGRIDKMTDRMLAGKTFSQKNLDSLLGMKDMYGNQFSTNLGNIDNVRGSNLRGTLNSGVPVGVAPMGVNVPSGIQTIDVGFDNPAFNNQLMAKVVGPALTQMRSLEKAKELSNLGYGTFSTEDQQKLDQLQKMDADQSKTYSMII